MVMPKSVPNAKANVRTTVDTVLLSTLLNKELNADSRIFNIKMEFIPSSQIWQIWVEHFKNTYIQINPDTLGKYDDMVKLAKEMADKLIVAMMKKNEVKKVGEKKSESV